MDGKIIGVVRLIEVFPKNSPALPVISMKKTALIFNLKSGALISGPSGFLSKCNLVDVKNKKELLERASSDDPLAIVIKMDSTMARNKSIYELLKTIKQTCDIPILAIAPKRGETFEIDWLSAGVVDIVYESNNSKRIALQLEKRITSFAELLDAKNQIKSLKNRIRRKNRDLAQSQAEIVRRLSLAAEHRDPETGDHIHRMSRYCHCIADASGLPARESQALLNASPLHDIGKLGIPDSVLLNPKKLTAEEWVIMKSHAEIGEKILSGSKSKLIQVGKVVAGTHHEKWDGTGYPNQLAGDAIPIYGRIAALADVFDAMTTKRVYQNPVSAHEAFAYIESQKGKHFDPELADFFLKSKQEALKIKARFPE